MSDPVHFGPAAQPPPGGPNDLPEEPTYMQIHLGIAEQGKLYALAGDHAKALHYYREAMHLSVQAGDPEVFFRHYLECVMESLEMMAAHPEVLDYCERAIQLYEENPPPNEMATMDLAHIFQRKGINLLKMGQEDEAIAALQQALETAKTVGRLTIKTMPLTQTVLQWLTSRYHIDQPRLLAEQQRTEYFIVRKDAIDPARAIRLPNENMIGF